MIIRRLLVTSGIMLTGIICLLENTGVAALASGTLLLFCFIFFSMYSAAFINNRKGIKSVESKIEELNKSKI